MSTARNANGLTSPGRERGNVTTLRSRPGLVLCFAPIASLFVAPLRADEIKGTFLRLHPDRDALTLKVGDAEQTFALTPQTTVLGLNKVPLKDGLRSSLFKQPGVFVRVTTEQQAVRELAILRRTASPFRGPP